MRIGIITTNLALFQNGLVQNAYFLYKVFSNGGHVCKMLSYEPSQTTLEGLDIPVTTISVNDWNPSDYDLIITVGKGITKKMYDLAKLCNTKIIGFVCGNVLAGNLCDFIGMKKGSVIGKGTPVDLIWLIGGHSYMKSYVELLRGTNVTIVPHLWSPSILEKHVEQKFKQNPTNLNYVLKPFKNVNILVIESNIEFIKTALIPIMIAEAVEHTNPTLIKELFVFNFPVDSSNAFETVDNLDICKKLRKFKSLHIGEIITYFNKQKEPFIVISHQINNPWNYLYYEMLYYGVPLVHNSLAFKEYGYYYEGCDAYSGAIAVKQVIDNHEKNFELYKAKNRLMLRTIDPDDKGCIDVWNALIN